MRQHFDAGMKLYKEMLDAGIAKECARFVLPRRANKNVHDGICKIMDPLYRSTIWTWNPERTYGYC